MILIPVKDLASAKQRLSSLLSQSARTELAHAMLRDVLEAVSQFSGDDVSLVTSDSFAMELAASFGFEIIRDDANLSETDAITMATRVCETRGIQTTVVIPGDVPLLQSAELATIYNAAPEAGSVLVPAHDQRGTNAILRRPAALFPLRFGNDSFPPHLSVAKAIGKPCVVLELPGIALDVDTPDDLRQLAFAFGDRRSQQLARRWLNSVPATGHIESVISNAVPTEL